ncbi:MAG: NADH-quinone oxidoreductase subunit A [Methanomassiliicoccales archaeon]|nr:NADH-quinone oxidoreductase subunit A [Methanomassiliicoccales archaeon]
MLVDDYFPVAIFALVALLIPFVAIFTGKLFRPTKHAELRETTYECGERPIGVAQIQFHVQFYIYAIIFVAFDIVTVFLLIWAMSFEGLSDIAKISAIAFLVIMLAGVFYSLKKEKILWI